MKVTLKNSFTINEPIARVWQFLSDPHKVAPCMPGAQILEQVDEKTFKGAMKMKLGPFSSQFEGEVVIEHMDGAAHEIRMVGKGKDPKGSGNATMTIFGSLKTLPDGGTEMTSQSDLVISGKIAQFGSRMIEDVSKTMFNKFTESFSAHLAAESTGQNVAHANEADAVSVTEVAGVVVKGMVRRMFKKDSE
ncbi:MAG: SRPBCC family protein [Deltaproteobacteria bacterium]|nr:SRPBCC family protein [Deltaproteobacteria bacterium]